MEKFSSKSKFVSAGSIMVLGLGISAVALTSSANADEKHALSTISHVSNSTVSISPAVLPSSMKGPSISSMPTGDDSFDDEIGSSIDDESSDD